MIDQQTFREIPDNRARRQTWIESAAPIYRTDIDADTVVGDDVFIRNYNLGSCILGTSIVPLMRMERSLEQISQETVSPQPIDFH